MNNRGMTLTTEIFIIVFFAIAALISVYILVKNITKEYRVDNSILQYQETEIKLERAAKKYIGDRKLSEKTIITADELKAKNLFDSSCDGYVIIDDTFYEPYIKCDNYTTTGYIKALAN